MSVLEQIRKRTGLLVGIIGLALVLFILQIGKGSGPSGPDEDADAAGVINGQKIRANDLQLKVNKFKEDMLKQNQGQDLNEQQRNQAVNQAWEEFIREMVYNEQFEKLGVMVTTEELYDQMLVHPHNMVVSQFRDPQSQKINEKFANPDGSLNVRELNKLVNSFDANQDEMWKNLETYIRQARLMEKYSALIKGGLYTTSAEAKINYAVQGTSYDVRFVLKKYADIPDADVKVTDADIQTYYNEHLYEFQNEVPSRSFEYVTWDIVPSKADIDTLTNELTRIAAEFQKIPADEDSVFVAGENGGYADLSSSLKDKLSPSIPDTFFSSPVGNVYGPFNENRIYKVIKLRGTEQINDSAKVRHILISIPNERSPEVKRTVAQSKSLADSLLALLKKDRKRFDEFVEKYSDDPGKKKPDLKANPQALMNPQVFPNPKDTNTYTGKGGNYGWLKESSGFVESFKDFGLKGKKGDLGVVPSQFGFHIMEVLDASKTTKTKYKIATISRELRPSDVTRNDFMQKASDFAGQNNTPEKFQKGVEALKLNKRLQEDLKENDAFVPGFSNQGESPKEMIRDIYKGKAGDVIPPRVIGDRIVVVLITKTKFKGPSELEFVKDDITSKVRDQKKAELIIKDFKAQMASCKNIDEFAAKTKLNIEKMDRLTFSSYAVPVYGKEDELIATATITPKGKMSEPGIGTAGVWVVQVENIKEPAAMADVKAIDMQKKLGRTAYFQRIQQGETNEALKKAANIEDHKSRFDY